MDNQHLSKCSTSGLTCKFNKIRQSTQHTGIETTNELIKTSNDLSDDSPNSPSFNLSQSSDLGDPSPLIHPSSSILSVLSPDDISHNPSISTPAIPQSLQKKPVSFKKPPKDQFSLKKSNSKSSLLTIEVVENHSKGKNRSKSQTDLPNECSNPSSSVFSEIALLKSQLEKAKQKIIISNSEMNRQRTENLLLKSQLKSMMESNNRSNQTVTCDCHII